MARMTVSFGGYLSTPADEKFPNWAEEVPRFLSGGSILATGMSKSYGDIASNAAGTVVSSLGLNRMISFDSELGVLVCEPGVLLHDIQETFVERGWMLPVTPGTSWITVAGAIANDVHGKDHHLAGTFGEHVLNLTVARSDGSLHVCSPSENPELFLATIGGLGLTGFILRATISLKPAAGPFFDTETIPFESLEDFFKLSQETDSQGWQASVGWFDCSTRKAGRGSFTRGNQSLDQLDLTEKKTRKSVNLPITPPFSLVNRVSLDLFNRAYFELQKSGAGKRRMHYQEFYYPLDGVKNWNRIYGPRGFFQYQSVIPMKAAKSATSEMLKVIRKSGQGSFLAVLKTFADREPAGLLSFARHGVTLALDFPNRGESTLALMESLDRIVAEAGGALNPSKDARMSRSMFKAGFPELPRFLLQRDPAFASDFSRRVID
ncbi:MAG: FAD-binding protein [Actinobacteria bacterium]|nr:FAD-binding protein [Actinomycetota bacterium]MTA29679.1 FAD-binding protein [Actinomycetota bacterium]